MHALTSRRAMHPITHFLGSWTLGDNVVVDLRDRNLITWAGVLPDLDGLGVALDAGQKLLGQPSSWHYGDYHHQLFHGLPGALLLPAILAPWGRRKLRVAAFGFLAVHLHLLCDVVGSRGPDATDIWPIWYLAPLSDRLAIIWSGQWPVNAWPNILITLVLLAYVFWAGLVRGHSVVGVFSKTADTLVVETFRARWTRVQRTFKRKV